MGACGPGASGPHPGLEKEMMLIGQFVGEWRVVECGYRDEGKWASRTEETRSGASGKPVEVEP